MKTLLLVLGAVFLAGCAQEITRHDNAVLIIEGRKIESLQNPAYSPDGRRVRSFRLAASGLLHWDGLDERGRLVTQGVYLAKLKAANRHVARKVILSR